MEKIYKAQSIGGINPPGVNIRIEEVLPDVMNITSTELRDFYDDQASSLADSLLENLPGGTMDLLLIKLLEFQVSSFVGSRK